MYPTKDRFNSHVGTHKSNGRGCGKMRLSLSKERNKTGRENQWLLGIRHCFKYWLSENVKLFRHTCSRSELPEFCSESLRHVSQGEKNSVTESILMSKGWLFICSTVINAPRHPHNPNSPKKTLLLAPRKLRLPWWRQNNCRRKTPTKIKRNICENATEASYT